MLRFVLRVLLTGLVCVELQPRISLPILRADLMPL